MKRIFFATFVILSVALSFSSCNNAEGVDDAVKGEVVTFKDFLWKDCQPDTVKVLLQTDFMDIENIDSPLVLVLCDENRKEVSNKIVHLYVDGCLSEDNTISIDPSKKETELWFILDKSQNTKDCVYSWNLKVKDNPGFKTFNDTPLSSDIVPGLSSFELTNNNVANPLKVGTDITLIVLLIIFAVVVLVMRLSHPAFKVKRLYVSTDGGQRSIMLSGASKVILTNKRQKQPALQALFFRKVIYFTDEFFTLGELVVEPKFGIRTDSGKRNGVRLASSKYDMEENTLAKDEETVIANEETNQKVIIKVQ